MSEPIPRLPPFQLGQATGADGVALVEACLAQIGPLATGANLGFVYATDALAPQFATLVAHLRRATGIAHWTGTLGLGICATGHEYYETPALAVMIGAMPPAAVHPLPLQRTALDPATVASGDAGGAPFGVVHADPTHPHTAALIAQLPQRLPGTFCVGGLTSSRGPHLQVAEEVCEGGLSGVLFDAAVPVVTSHTQGCTPIGVPHRVTACDRNIVIELDHRPALDVFKEDVGAVIAQDLRRAGGYIFAAIPVAGSDTGDYLVRNLLGIDPAQKLLAIGEMLQVDDPLMFCRRDGNTARTDLQRMLADLAARMGPAPRGALYYSCLARGRHQFGDNAQELRLIREALGEIPLVGFFANGEIFHNRMYAHTGVLTIFT